MFRAWRPDFKHAKYYLCVGEIPDSGSFVMVSSPTREQRSPRNFVLGRYQINGNLLPIPLNKEKLSEFDLLTMISLDQDTIEMAIDFGKIGRSLADRLSNLLRLNEVKEYHQIDEWCLAMEVLAGCTGDDPAPALREELESGRFKRCLSAHDTRSATLLAAAVRGPSRAAMRPSRP